jgi:hypothetical protein
MGPDGLAGSADDQWVPAVLGNFGSKRHRFVGVMAYDPDDLDLELGDYGVNTATHTVWAILDHTSQFGVVPEPSGLVLLAAAAAALLVARRFISRATAGAR